MNPTLKKHTLAILAIAFLSIAYSCDSPKSGKEGARKKKDPSLLQEAQGGRSEVLLVMDSVQWNGPLGRELRVVFEEDISYLMNPEPIFTVRHILPWDFKYMLRKHTNIIMVNTFDQQTAGSRVMKDYYTEQSIQRIKSDTSLFYLLKQDIYARGQHIMMLFSPTEEELIQKLRTHKKQLQNVISEHEDQRASEKLFAVKSNRAAQKELKEMGATMKIPEFYQLVPALDIAPEPIPFLWARSVGTPGKAADNNIFVTYKEYTSQDQFKLDSLIAWRDTVCRYQMFTNYEERPDSYLKTEKRSPIDYEVKTLDGKYAVKLNGLWQANDLSMGGVFNAYAVADPENRRIYYIEGMVIALGMDKREPLREVDIILRSFQILE